MAKNKLKDLNNHLFAQLERLSDEDYSEEKIETEIKRAKAISGLASEVLKIAKLSVDVTKMVSSGQCFPDKLPEMIGEPSKPLENK